MHSFSLMTPTVLQSGSNLTGRWNRRWVTLTKKSVCLFQERTVSSQVVTSLSEGRQVEVRSACFTFSCALQDGRPKTLLKLRDVKEIAPSKKMVMTTSGMQDVCEHLHTQPCFWHTALTSLCPGIRFQDHYVRRVQGAHANLAHTRTHLVT